MAVNSMYFAAINTTTVDNLTRHTRVHHLAVSIPHLEFSDQYGGLESHRNDPGGSTISTYSHNPSSQNAVTPNYTVIRHPYAGQTYAILQTPTAGNIYRLESAVANMKTVMGCTWYDWLLPIKMSPCCSHHQLSRRDASGSSGLVSMYQLGPLVDTMRIQAGVVSSQSKSYRSRRGSKKHRRRRRRIRRRNGTQGGSENGECRQEGEGQQLPVSSDRPDA